ncbi:LOW QUALITY PROTEIN: hypothetical protein KUTeg_015738 [Tegillarca granosa]|uniref:Uncharacterized protein n=1 Tax=Tegillarca granosa TaxID=220873 RepID=A0ABQ9EN54_TEGGR|nr:LOW QUALITY PROTEIN: hypothetical protein KUTeg_015738 [Tegillarca granosa]
MSNETICSIDSTGSVLPNSKRQRRLTDQKTFNNSTNFGNQASQLIAIMNSPKDTSKTIVDDFKIEINSLKKENQMLKSENDSLRVKVDDLEQYSRRNAIRAFSESAEENIDVFKQVSREIGIELTDTDIDRSHRTGKQITGRIRGTCCLDIIDLQIVDTDGFLATCRLNFRESRKQSTIVSVCIVQHFGSSYKVKDHLILYSTPKATDKVMNVHYNPRALDETG